MLHSLDSVKVMPACTAHPFLGFKEDGSKFRSRGRECDRGMWPICVQPWYGCLIVWYTRNTDPRASEIIQHMHLAPINVMKGQMNLSCFSKTNATVTEGGDLMG